MTYKVVKKEVEASRDGKDFGFKVQRYYATWYGREPVTEPPLDNAFVEVWADGSITLHKDDSIIFLYQDQWSGIVVALQEAINDKKIKRDSERKAWMDSTKHSKEFYGVPVDLSRAEVIAAIESSPIEVEAVSNEMVANYSRPLIRFNKNLYHLCRTDLMDDVSTGLCKNLSAEQWRAHYLEKAQSCMGARIKDKSFCVIDAYSDG
jgi:hypothetical protein